MATIARTSASKAFTASARPGASAGICRAQSSPEPATVAAEGPVRRRGSTSRAVAAHAAYSFVTVWLKSSASTARAYSGELTARSFSASR